MPRGGSRNGAGRKPYPDFTPGGVAINAANCYAYVSRWQRVGAGFQLVPASNWEELQEQAEQEIERLGGHVTMSAIYPCSPELAAAATWEAA